MVGEDGKADQDQDGVEDDERAADVVLVSDPAKKNHQQARGGVGRSDQALRRGYAEPHIETEDDGEEVGDGICLCGRGEEDQSEAPDLQVEAGAQPLLEAERLRVGVAAVLVHLVHDEASLALVEEAPGLVGLVGEVDEEQVSDGGDDAGELLPSAGYLGRGTRATDDAFQDEDPPPACLAGGAVHLHNLDRSLSASGSLIRRKANLHRRRGCRPMQPRHFR